MLVKKRRKENKKFVIFNINTNNTLYSKIYSYDIRGNKTV